MENIPFEVPDDLPYMMDTEDFATLLNIDIDKARREIRKHKDVLRPFKIGKGTKIFSEAVRHYLALKLNESIDL